MQTPLNRYAYAVLTIVFIPQASIAQFYQTPSTIEYLRKLDLKTEEQRLLNHLLTGYETAVRPVRNASEPVAVKLSLALTNIFDVDEKKQVLLANVWFEQEWRDELLQWDPNDFDGITSVRIPCDLIWLPDIVLYNSADDFTVGYMRAGAIVFHDGTVFWPPPMQIRSTCKIDVTYFPFDSQRCFMKFGSWTYHGKQVDISNRTMKIDLTNYNPSGEFDLVNVHQMRQIVQYPCCVDPFPDMTFFIHVRRKTLYYMINVIFPCMMMSALTLLVFCLPPESGEKIVLGIAVILEFSVFVLQIAEKMPETSDITHHHARLQTNLLCELCERIQYLTTVMGMTSVSVMMTVLVLNVHHRGPINKEIPQWMRWLVLEKLRRLLCMKFPQSQSPQRNPTTAPNDSPLMWRFLLKTTNIDEKMDISGMSTVAGPWMYQNGSAKGGTEFPNGNFIDSEKRRGGCENCHKLQEEILQTLQQVLLSRQERENDCEKMANDWRQVAQVVDRLLFCIFLIATVGITLTLLIIIPWVRHSLESDEFDERLFGLSN